MGNPTTESVATRPPKLTLGRAIGLFAACFVVYLAVLEAFLAIHSLNDLVQVRPASAFGPVLGLFFGMPGILGCAFANLVSDAIHGLGSPLTLAGFFIVQVFYNGFVRWIWYAFNRKSEHPYPRFESASKTALYMGLALLDSVLVNVAAFFVADMPAAEMPMYIIRILNNIWMLIYVGMPLLYFLECSRLNPVPPHWIKAPYRSIGRANLTQRLVLWFTIGAALLMLISSLVVVASAQPGELSTIVLSVYTQVALLSIPIYLLLFGFLHILEKSFTRPIEVLASDQRSFIARIEEQSKQGIDDMPISVDERGITPRYEIRELFDSTNAMRSDMTRFMKRVHDYTVERERASTELDIARQIQLSAVPHDFNSLTERFGLDIAGSMRPAREVGGDFYDVFETGEHGVAFIIGDVSGKGVPAALFMMRAQSLLKQYLLETDDLGVAFTLANRQLCERNDTLLFVTAFACVIDTSTGLVRYANAGHNPPVLLQAGVRKFLKCRAGLVLGAMDTVQYREEQFASSPGDGLLLYTDGVTEAQNIEEELFGEERLLDALNAADERTTESSSPSGSHMPSHVQHAVDALGAAVDSFAGDAPQADDITLLAFRWNLPIHKLTLAPEDRELERLFAFLEPLCQGDGMTGKMMAQLMLVCEELFVNISHYGFPDGQPRLPVEIEVAVDERAKRMHIVFADQGIAYDPLSHNAKKADPTDEERKGGLGILLMRTYLDDMRYTYADGRNILRMTKSFV